MSDGMATESENDPESRDASKPAVFGREAHLDSILETVPDAMIVID